MCYVDRVWEVSLLAEVEAWFLNLCDRDPVSADRVAEAIDLLAENGPHSAGRRSTGSRAADTTT
jgi:hypothetical protein